MCKSVHDDAPIEAMSEPDCVKSNAFVRQLPAVPCARVDVVTASTAKANTASRTVGSDHSWYYAAFFSRSDFHWPTLARPFIRARCEKARCAAATFSDLPDHVFCGACWSARPYENVSFHGRSAMRF